MKESAIRSIVVSALKRYAAFAVENPAHDGTPDVCSTLGWIELKVVPCFPSNSDSRVGVGLRKAQKLWMRRWNHCGGSVLILTVVGQEWFIHEGGWAAMAMTQANEASFRRAALHYWAARPTLELLRGALERCHGIQGTQESGTEQVND